MARDELAEFTRSLQRLSTEGVERVHETTYNDCRYDGKHVPPAAAIQQLSCSVASAASFQAKCYFETVRVPVAHSGNRRRRKRQTRCKEETTSFRDFKAVEHT